MTTTSNGTASSDSTDLAGVLRLEDDLPAVHFERLFRTDAADLWTSVTDPDCLIRWFQPVSGDLQAGGAYRIDFGEDVTTGVIQTCDVPSSFAVMWDFAGEPTSLLSVQVQEHPDGAVLVLDHSRMPQEQGAGYGAGWHAHLDTLDAELTGTAAGDWSQRWGGLVGDYRERLDALRSSHSGTSTG